MTRTALGENGIRWTAQGDTPHDSLITIITELQKGYDPMTREQTYKIRLPGELPYSVKPRDKIVFPLGYDNRYCGNITAEYKTQTLDRTTWEDVPAHVFNVWWNINNGQGLLPENPSRKERDRFLNGVR